MIKSTFSILFLIRKSRLGKTGESPISMRMTVNGRFTEMSTLRKVPANLWDSKKERAVGKGPAQIEINRHRIPIYRLSLIARIEPSDNSIGVGKGFHICNLVICFALAMARDKNSGDTYKCYNSVYGIFHNKVNISY